jgi:hypothetical protein
MFGEATTPHEMLLTALVKAPGIIPASAPRPPSPWKRRLEAGDGTYRVVVATKVGGRIVEAHGPIKIGCLSGTIAAPRDCGSRASSLHATPSTYERSSIPEHNSETRTAAGIVGDVS